MSGWLNQTMVPVWSLIVVAIIATVASGYTAKIIDGVGIVLKRFSLYLYNKVGKPRILKIKYAYRIILKKPTVLDRLLIGSKIRDYSASKLELRAFKEVNKNFTTMEEFNKLSEQLEKHDIKITPEYINPIRKL